MSQPAQPLLQPPQPPEKKPRMYWSLWTHVRDQGLQGAEVYLRCDASDTRRIAKAVRKERWLDTEFNQANPGYVLYERRVDGGMMLSLRPPDAAMPPLIPHVDDDDM